MISYFTIRQDLRKDLVTVCNGFSPWLADPGHERHSGRAKGRKVHHLVAGKKQKYMVVTGDKNVFF